MTLEIIRSKLEKLEPANNKSEYHKADLKLIICRKTNIQTKIAFACKQVERLFNDEL